MKAERVACRRRRLPAQLMGRVIRLRDVPRNAEGGYHFDALSTVGELFAVEVWHAYQAQAQLDEAVRQGIVTPAQRPYLARVAALDLAAFRGLLATMRREALGGND